MTLTGKRQFRLTVNKVRVTVLDGGPQITGTADFYPHELDSLRVVHDGPTINVKHMYREGLALYLGQKSEATHIDVLEYKDVFYFVYECCECRLLLRDVEDIAELQI